MGVFVGVIFGIFCLEIIIFFIVRHFRKEYQWLIVADDESPKFDVTALKKFLHQGFDPFLGWTRKPNTSGFDNTPEGKVEYRIDNFGARENPTLSPIIDTIATFGDSYTFCRQVRDDETWQALLSRHLQTGVQNFGVGNYGADQALLRYENTTLASSVKIVILGFVPETICRIQSYWKHYLEFGNTFAFKPRFTLENGKLVLHPSAMSSLDDFLKYKENLPKVRKIDGFYTKKFRSLQFRFPYLFSFFRHPNRNLKLLYSLIIRGWARKRGKSLPQIENEPFNVTMSYNILESHKMYKNNRVCELFTEILIRFKLKAQERGHLPVVLVMPQLIDVKLFQKGKAPCTEFFKNLDIGIPVWDLTTSISTQNVSELYTEDSYGGHFSSIGNRLVSEYLKTHLIEKYSSIFQGNLKKIG
jgi:hypothetical protein